MATSEIEKLERRYAENPQGLTFAPLAEVHRKNGDVPRALELLLAGLELHPNYIPASIVLGRCYWDLGDLAKAESAFAHVLRLDDENVIALKSLADINERLERFGEAQRWLHRLVSVDRSNEEAREQLTRLEAIKDRGPRPAAATQGPPPASEVPHEIVAVEPAPVKPVPGPPAATPPSPSEPAVPDLTTGIAEPAPALDFIDTSDPSPKTAQSPKAADLEPPAPEPLAGLSTHEFVPPQENTYRLHPELTREFVPGKEPPAERFDVETAEEVELQSSGASEFRVPNAAEEFMDLAAAINADFAAPPRVPERPVEARPSPAPRPTPPPQPPEPNPAPVEAVAASRPVEAPKPAYSVQETKGQSVGSFFQTLLAARPPGNPKAMPATDSTAPGPSNTSPQVPDEQSVDTAFGPSSQPNTPPVPAGGQLKDAAVSFDDFFSSSGGGTSPATPGGGEPKNDDLDSFQSWLQNLKR
jgi:tetratricopeptide (TPR) repeat protein